MVENGSVVEDDQFTAAMSVPGYVEVGGGERIDTSGLTQPETTEYIEVGVSTVKRFNILVGGGMGSGKTTFAKRILQRYFPNLKIKPCEGSTLLIEERGRCEKRQGSTRIIFTVVDTPGFGDSINNDDRITPVIEYIEAQNRKYEEAEGYRHFDQQQDDTRIHCCFYFFTPHRVTSLDLEFMRRLQSKVPIVPIVAKTDTPMTKEKEQQLYNIHKALQEHKIKIFDFEEPSIDASWLETFPSTSGSEEESSQSPFKRVGEALQAELDHTKPEPAVSTEKNNNKNMESLALRRQIPNVFAVISGRREYPWGVACEDNPLHSDTPRLHDALFKNRSLQSLGRLQSCANRIHDAWRKAREEGQRTKNDLKALEEEETKKRLEQTKMQQLRLDRELRKAAIFRGLAVVVLMAIYSILWVLRYHLVKEESTMFLLGTLIPRGFELFFFVYVALKIATTQAN